MWKLREPSGDVADGSRPVGRVRVRDSNEYWCISCNATMQIVASPSLVRVRAHVCVCVCPPPPPPLSLSFSRSLVLSFSLSLSLSLSHTHTLSLSLSLFLLSLAGHMQLDLLQHGCGGTAVFGVGTCTGVRARARCAVHGSWYMVAGGWCTKWWLVAGACVEAEGSRRRLRQEIRGLYN